MRGCVVRLRLGRGQDSLERSPASSSKYNSSSINKEVDDGKKDGDTADVDNDDE